MKILVLGASGMLGHKLLQKLGSKYDVSGTVRGNEKAYQNHPILSNIQLIGNVEAKQFGSVIDASKMINPDVIINCIGIVKQLPAAQDPIQSITINALFPHQLANFCINNDIRLIHMSTDCVFSGSKGNYTENEPSDAEDLYGRTKFLGEVDYPGCLTLRTSIIGRELRTSHGLLEWFLDQSGNTVKGYKKAIFSGLTTNALAEIISIIISDFPEIHGVWHVASEPISKYDLLALINGKLELDVTMLPDETVISDRSLMGEKFRQYTNINIPSWSKMIEQIHDDPTPYHLMRKNHADR
ncbi:SDR family oxidoreductase [Methanogenium marinum]|uniref:SDR family oxidoreductase n=1 Tax=Methanogenium marinum TaxID=348610 RepID=A0A9Q4KRV7_9EURY|nr:SDR family oxidoreductase [Methanogenium marinum]MDE4907351.1 SDR family oxidoreductase [Methanogenium marinum]